MSSANPQPRKASPVFVIGCHRSGTALLYDNLLSAGGFPLFHACPYVHTGLIRICGDPSVPRNREKLLHLWLRSKAFRPFRRTGLGPDDLREKLLEDGKSLARPALHPASLAVFPRHPAN